MTRHAGIAACLLLALAGVAAAAERQLVEFSLKDQFGTVHRRDDVEGKVVLLIGADGDGSQHNASWSKALNDSVADNPNRDELVELAHADLRGVPFFARGYVRGLMPEDPDEPVLLDWRGSLAKAYGYEPGVTNVLVFDPTGLLVARASGSEPDPAQLEALTQALRAELNALPPGG